MVKHLIFDLDGTIYWKGKEIPGALATIKKLEDKGYKVSFVTNTDSKPESLLHEKIKDMGIEIPLENLYTPVVAVKKYAVRNPGKSYFCLTSRSVEESLELDKNDENPDYVIIGDFSDRMDFGFINKGFRLIQKGAEMLALAKFLIYYTAQGPNLNTGAFVAMLEHVTGKQAKLLGKPSPDFLRIACDDQNSLPSETLVIGDDITTDILGAYHLGAKSILLRTGHFAGKDLEASPVKPDFILQSIANIPEVLNDLNRD